MDPGSLTAPNYRQGQQCHHSDLGLSLADSTNSFSLCVHLSMLDGSRIYRRLISPSFQQETCGVRNA